MINFFPSTFFPSTYFPDNYWQNYRVIIVTADYFYLLGFLEPDKYLIGQIESLSGVLTISLPTRYSLTGRLIRSQQLIGVLDR